jgi:soluble lytic murein transglycosylase-like protein
LRTARTDVISTAGAQGLMQLMPTTAARFGVSDSMDAAQNIKGGVAYLGWLLDRFGNDPVLVLAGYNAGEGNVQRYQGVPPFAETMDYAPKVLAAWQVAKGLCQTPPDLITDGCVFNVNALQ